LGLGLRYWVIVFVEVIIDITIPIEESYYVVIKPEPSRTIELVTL